MPLESKDFGCGVLFPNSVDESFLSISVILEVKWYCINILFSFITIYYFFLFFSWDIMDPTWKTVNMKIIQVWFEYFMLCIAYVITLYKTSKMQSKLWKAM